MPSSPIGPNIFWAKTGSRQVVPVQIRAGSQIQKTPARPLLNTRLGSSGYMEVYQGRHQTDSDMVGSLRLQASNPPLGSYPKNVFAGNTDVRPKLIYKQRPMQSFSSLTLQSRSDDIALPSTCELSNFTSTVGSSLITSSSLQLSHWNLTQRHVTLLNLVACLVPTSLSHQITFPPCFNLIKLL